MLYKPFEGYICGLVQASEKLFHQMDFHGSTMLQH